MAFTPSAALTKLCPPTRQPQGGQADSHHPPLVFVPMFLEVGVATGAARSLLPLASFLHGLSSGMFFAMVRFQSGPCSGNPLSALLSGGLCILSKAPLRCAPRVWALLTLS